MQACIVGDLSYLKKMIILTKNSNFSQLFIKNLRRNGEFNTKKKMLIQYTNFVNIFEMQMQVEKKRFKNGIVNVVIY